MSKHRVLSQQELGLVPPLARDSSLGPKSQNLISLPFYLTLLLGPYFSDLFELHPKLPDPQSKHYHTQWKWGEWKFPWPGSSVDPKLLDDVIHLLLG